MALLIASAAARAATLTVTCPACHEVQARARGTDLRTARCRRCHAPLAGEKRDKAR